MGGAVRDAPGVRASGAQRRRRAALGPDGPELNRTGRGRAANPRHPRHLDRIGLLPLWLGLHLAAFVFRRRMDEASLTAGETADGICRFLKTLSDAV